MIEIQNGKERALVTFGAFKNIFEKLGWSELIVGENERLDIPINKMSVEQLREKAVLDGFNLDSVKAMKKEELKTLFEE